MTYNKKEAIVVGEKKLVKTGKWQLKTRHCQFLFQSFAAEKQEILKAKLFQNRNKLILRQEISLKVEIKNKYFQCVEVRSNQLSITKCNLTLS